MSQGLHHLLSKHRLGVLFRIYPWQSYAAEDIVHFVNLGALKVVQLILGFGF